MANWGFVYILSNESMPGIYKIGCTASSPMKRAEELSGHSGCPTPFTIVCYVETDDYYMAERSMHEMYSSYRVNSSREFFRFTVDHLIREVCQNLRDEGINFTECEEYDMLDFKLRKQEEQGHEADS